ncbi:MAG: nitroreductase family protein [Armatimonadota bacterium]
MDAIECLKTRRSIRKFENTPIPREVIEDIVDCGRLAATAINIQPWIFIAIQHESRRKAVADVTDYGKFIAEAPLCIAVFCQNSKYYLEDGCAATQNILNAAKAHGLGSCWIAGDKKDYAKGIARLLNVPDDFNLVSLIAVGFHSQDTNPPKKPLSEVMHWELFNKR